MPPDGPCPLSPGTYGLSLSMSRTNRPEELPTFVRSLDKSPAAAHDAPGALAWGGSLESLRDLNRWRVVEILRSRGTASRAEIARQTGLSRSTVSSLVADLQASGLIVERGTEEPAHDTHGGRPPVLLALSPSAGAAIGIDFGHRHLRVAVADLSSTILAETSRELDVNHAATEGLELAAALVTELLEEAGVAPGRRPARGG